jgi:hypothetical protein
MLTQRIGIEQGQAVKKRESRKTDGRRPRAACHRRLVSYSRTSPNSRSPEPSACAAANSGRRTSVPLRPARVTGDFLGPDTHEGTPVLVRYRWSDITPTGARWAQAFSTDNGVTWETNWTADFTRGGLRVTAVRRDRRYRSRRVPPGGAKRNRRRRPGSACRLPLGVRARPSYLAPRRRKPKPSERVRVAVNVSNSTGVGYGPEPDQAEVW